MPFQEILERLISVEVPPEARRSKSTDGTEHKLTEAAVMLAYAAHLFRQGATEVLLHPDPEHTKRFDMRGWLEGHGFSLIEPEGSTRQTGWYERGGLRIRLRLTPGLGDIHAIVRGVPVTAEAKGGVINSRHAGVISKLRGGLFHAVGQALYLETIEKGRHVAVLPMTDLTMRMATRLAGRLALAGVEIALVSAEGIVTEI